MTLYKKKGHIWSKADSQYYRKSEGVLELDFKMIRLMLLRYLVGLIAAVANILMFQTTVSAGVSSSFMTSLFSATSVFCSVLFYFVFDEKLLPKHLLGILLMMVSVVLIANS